MSTRGVGAFVDPVGEGEPQVDAAAGDAWAAPCRHQLGGSGRYRGPLANALRSWSVLRFEVTEDPSEGVDGHRWCHTPQLGLWSGVMSANGDVMVGEMRLRGLMAAGADALAAEMDTVLGTAWDEALEAYRGGGDTGEVTWLNRGVG